MRMQASIAVAVLVVLSNAGVRAGSITYPEPCLKSVLCGGLAEHFNFDEGSNSLRSGAFMGQLYENPSTVLPNRAGKLGNALDFQNNAAQYLWNSSSGAPTGIHSVGFWFWADSAGAPSAGNFTSLVSWDMTSDHGSYIELFNDAGTQRLCYVVYPLDTDVSTSAYSCTAGVSLDAWHYAVVGMQVSVDGNGNSQGVQVFTSLDGGTKGSATSSANAGLVGFQPRTGFFQVRIGQRPYNGATSNGDTQFDGAVDELSIWGRELTNAEIVLLYNGGAGRTYPFVTE